MNLKYLGKYDGANLRPTSFWVQLIRYDFELSWDDSEENMVEMFEKELKLNCGCQL